MHHLCVLVTILVKIPTLACLHTINGVKKFHNVWIIFQGCRNVTPVKIDVPFFSFRVYWPTVTSNSRLAWSGDALNWSESLVFLSVLKYLDHLLLIWDWMPKMHHTWSTDIIGVSPPYLTSALLQSLKKARSNENSHALDEVQKLDLKDWAQHYRTTERLILKLYKHFNIGKSVVSSEVEYDMNV